MKLQLLYTLDELRCAFDCDNIITDFHAWHNKRFKCNPGELSDRNRKTSNAKSFTKLKKTCERYQDVEIVELPGANKMWKKIKHPNTSWSKVGRKKARKV